MFNLQKEIHNNLYISTYIKTIIFRYMCLVKWRRGRERKFT